MKLTQFLKKRFRIFQGRRKDQALDSYFNQKGKIAYSGILRGNQEKRLCSKVEKMVEEYALDIFGNKSCSPWLKVYTAFRGEFPEGWMPVNYWGRIVCPKLNGALQPIGRIKTISKRILKTEAIPDLGDFIKGNWITESGESIVQNEAKKMLFTQFPFVFLKKDHSFQGQGVIKLTPSGFDRMDFSQAGDFVIQAPISQHPFFERLSPGSVASLRVTTFKEGNQKAKNHQASIRLGLAGSSFISGDNCVRVPIWEKEGRLYDYGFSGTWDSMKSHPDTGVKFSGLMIPEFGKIAGFCERLHDQNPHFPLIAWDVILDQSNQIQIMEWNTVIPTIGLSEAATGPHFKGLGFVNIWKQNDLSRF